MSFRRTAIGSAIGIGIFYGGLILSVGYFLDPHGFFATLRSERTLFSIGLSLEAATLAAAMALLVALPAGYALSRYRFRGRRLIDTLLEFPMIVSPAALGAMLLIFFNNPLGEWIQEHLLTFVFAFWGIVLAQFATVLGVAVRFVKSAFDEIPPELESTARTLGASPGYLFRTVSLPLARRGIASAAILTWAKALGEFGATITVAGTMAMRTETLPIAIFMRLETADITGTVTLIVILVTIGLGALFGAHALLERKGRG
ncbi:ABC transporter permease [Nitratifractor sp.]